MTNTTSSTDARAALSIQIAEAALKVLALCVPLLYAIGRAYHEGYWRSIGLTPSLMPASVEDYLYSGFVAILGGLAGIFGVAGRASAASLLGYTAILSAVVVFVLSARTLFRTTFHRPARRAEARLRRWRSKHRGTIKRLLLPLAAVIYSAYSLALVVFGSIFALVLTVALAYESGKSRGDETRTAFEAQLRDNKAFPAAMARVGSSPKFYLLLQCSGQWCIVFDRNGFQAVAPDTVSSIGHFLARRQARVSLTQDQPRLPVTFMMYDGKREPIKKSK